MEHLILTILYATAVSYWLIIKLLRVARRPPGLPPGPQTIPLLGNLHLFPKEFAHYK
jgi:hypothetical protein